MPRSLWTAFILCTSIACAQDLRPPEVGPISTRNGRAVSLVFMRFVPRIGHLEKGEIVWESGIQMINDVRRWPKNVGLPSVVEEDAETERVSFTMRKGLGNGAEFSFELPLVVRWGGIEDPIIDWWHHTILPASERVRDHLARGRVIVREPGSPDFGLASGIGDVSLFLSQRLTRRLTAMAGLKIPVGNAGGLIGSGNVDGGVYLSYTGAINKHWQYDVGAGFVIQGKPEVLKHARGLVHQELFALTWHPNSRDSWIGQFQGEASPTVTGIPEADATHRTLTFGYARRLSNTQRLELYFSEDEDLLPGASNLISIGPDFTVGIRFTKRFK